MFKIKIFSIHKTKHSWLDDAISEYEKRLKGTLTIEFVICKNETDLEKKLLKEKLYICLDEKGQKLTSIQFSKKIFEFFEKDSKSLSFAIGSENGLSSIIKANAKAIFSLSDMTFTHHMARLILVEQLYRAFEIRKNSKYHK